MRLITTSARPTCPTRLTCPAYLTATVHDTGADSGG
jgi:hypothetical protein